MNDYDSGELPILMIQQQRMCVTESEREQKHFLGSQRGVETLKNS